jgi:hypothetical protein
MVHIMGSNLTAEQPVCKKCTPKLTVFLPITCRGLKSPKTNVNLAKTPSKLVQIPGSPPPPPPLGAEKWSAGTVRMAFKLKIPDAIRASHIQVGPRTRQPNFHTQAEGLCFVFVCVFFRGAAQFCAAPKKRR